MAKVPTQKELDNFTIPRNSSIASAPSSAMMAYLAGKARLPYVLDQLGFPSLRRGQDIAVDSIMLGNDSVVILPTATGKCYAAGTQLRRYDGSVVKAEDMQVGDKLIGPDSKVRTIVSLTRGYGDMFEIRPRSGESHTVNADHVLVLSVTPSGKVGSAKDKMLCLGKTYYGGDLIDISVADYLRQNKTFKHRTKLIRTGLNFKSSAKLPIPPYILGVWLGDGHLHQPDVTKPDSEIRESIQAYAKDIGANFVEKPNSRYALTFQHASGGCKGGGNVFINKLRETGVFDRKHVPIDYKVSRREDRLQLLAGLLDTDGSITCNMFEVTFKDEVLADDTMELALSLGLSATKGEKWVRLKGWNKPRQYFRIHIGGDIHLIPTRIRRKQAQNIVRRTNALRRSFEVLPVGKANYYGCAVKGTDHRIMLADYTITHNSACFIVPTLCMNWRTIIIYPLISLIKDQMKHMLEFGLEAGGISSSESDQHNASVLNDWASGKLQFMLVSPERFANPEWARVVSMCPPDFCALDEAHTFHQWADTFRSGYKVAGDFISKVNPKVVAAFSATLMEDAEHEVRNGLGIQNAKLVYYCPRRDNLHLKTVNLDTINDAFAKVEFRQGPTVVYASTTKRVEAYASIMQRYTNRKVFIYHGKLDKKVKSFNQDGFMADNNAIIFATNAFGMGVDKKNIRNVWHFDIPGSLIAYSQETGRAGRDGQDSDCYIIYTPEGERTQRFFIRMGNPTSNDIKDFVQTALTKADKYGVIDAKRDEICRDAGLDSFASQAIMTFCLGEGIFVHDADAAKKLRVQFKDNIVYMTPKEMTCRDAIIQYGVIDKQQFYHVDSRALVEQLGYSQATLYKRLDEMASREMLTWVRPSSSKPLRYARRLEDVPVSSFDRMDKKSANADALLEQVLILCATPDDEKHTYLESHMLR